MKKSSQFNRLSKKPIFIAGSSASGSTILGKVLANHPDVLNFNEPSFFLSVSYVLNGKITPQLFFDIMNDSKYNHIENIVNSLKFSKVDHAQAVYTRDFIELLFAESFIPERNIFEAMATFVDRIFHTGIVKWKKLRWIQKQPFVLYHLDWTYRMFPDMKLIHIIRNPKDVCCSMLVRDPELVNSVQEFINFYTNIISLGVHFMKEFPEDQALVISLENLVKSPVEKLKMILEFAELTYNHEQIFEWAGQINEDKAHIGRYRKELSREDSERIDNSCGIYYEYLCDLEQN
jgi:hypothetical protein